MSDSRRAYPSSHLRSPFEHILNMFQLSGIPQGHEKPLKHAFYNAAALFLLFVSCLATYGLYLILRPFIKPLFWALLVGSVLYPVKRDLSEQIKIWFINLEESNMSIVIGVMHLPVKFIDYLSEMLGSWIYNHAKIIIILTVGLPSLHCFYYYTPINLACIIWKGLLLSDILFTWIINIFNRKFVLSFMTCYVLAIFCFWTPERNTTFKKTGILVWLVISCYLSNVFGFFPVPIFLLIQISALGSWFYKEHFHNINDQPASEIKGAVQFVKAGSAHADNNDSLNLSEDAVDKSLLHKMNEEEITKPSHLPISFSILKSPLIMKVQSNGTQVSLESDIYFRLLFYACGFLLMWKQLWVLSLLPIPVFAFLFKKLWNIFGMHKKVLTYVEDFRNMFDERKKILMSPPVEGILVLFQTIHKLIMKIAMDSIDGVSSAVVILALLLFVSSAFLFISLQIYSEIIQMIQMGSSIVNKTIIHNPKLLELLPPEVEESVDNMLENAYQYGRDGISNLVHSFLQDADDAQARRLESQMLALWDRVYQSWVDSTNLESQEPDAVRKSFYTFMEDLYNSPELFNLAVITNWTKQNLGTLTGLLESALSLLRGNLELLLGIITAVIQLLLGSSTAVFTWALNSVVFFTTLFYLLASSNKQYRPVEVLSALSGEAKVVKRISNALEESVAGVFLATFKMSLFYGLWTWIIHTAFGTNIVYLPTLIAASLAAIPFLGTYWACVAGVLELWCLQDKFWSAVGLAAFQFVPTTLLDTTLYNEIKGGGHPYLTGLSIAGGLWCLGPEGALLGPLLLCLLVVVTDLTTAAIQESPINLIK